MKEEIDYECLISIILEISDRIQLINRTLIPKEKEPVIQHLAAASIHIALFMQDTYTDKEGKENINASYMEEFLKKCGCDYLKKNEN